MKKLILAALIASTLSACGGSSDDSPATPTIPDVPTTPDMPMTPIEPSEPIIEPTYTVLLMPYHPIATEYQYHDTVTLTSFNYEGTTVHGIGEYKEFTDHPNVGLCRDNKCRVTADYRQEIDGNDEWRTIAIDVSGPDQMTFDLTYYKWDVKTNVFSTPINFEQRNLNVPEYFDTTIEGDQILVLCFDVDSNTLHENRSTDGVCEPLTVASY